MKFNKIRENLNTAQNLTEVFEHIQNIKIAYKSDNNYMDNYKIRDLMEKLIKVRFPEKILNTDLYRTISSQISINIIPMHSCNTKALDVIQKAMFDGNKGVMKLFSDKPAGLIENLEKLEALVWEYINNDKDLKKYFDL